MSLKVLYTYVQEFKRMSREEFLSRAVNESTVVVHASDFQLRSHTYTFHLDGLEDALARLTCR